MLKMLRSKMDGYFKAPVLARAEEAYRESCVLNVRLRDGLLKARVKSNTNQLYDIHIDIKAWPRTPTHCTCTQKTACEHAASSLFALLYGQKPPEFSEQVHSARTSHILPEIIDADDLEWYSDAEKSEQDFFEYKMGIMIDGQAINIVPVVIDFLTQMHRRDLETVADEKLVLLNVAEGKQLRISFARIKPLLRLLMEYSSIRGSKSRELKLRRYHLVLLEEAERAIRATSARWVGTDDTRQRLAKLTFLQDLPVIDVPQGLCATLRDYQKQGLNWLQCLRDNGFSGILADDMGLGKTVQTLAHLQYEKEQGRLKKASLLIAPTSLVMNWWEEAQRFTPDLRVLIYHGASRHVDQFDDFDLVVSTYGLIQRDQQRFLDGSFYYLILDEAQFIKNARTKTTLIIQQLQATHRLCLTGTPLENHLGELWSLFHFLMPGLLGTPKQFRQFFRTPIERQADVSRQVLLAGRVQPFMLRRTKNEVARELPAKTEITHMVELQGTQRDVYEAIRMAMEKKVREAIARQGLGKSQIILLDALLKLRQVCCDPRLLTLPEAAIAYGNSAKLDALMNLLDGLLQEGRRVLVFSQFTSMLTLIEEQLIQRQYAYFKLTGKTSNRQELVRRFQEGEVPLFLISLKAGGTGLNLTKADTVILYDPWWNPAVQDQAMDRSHRIGQKNPVFVYKLLTVGTVEEVILRIQEKKRQLVDDVFSTTTSGHLMLTEQDLQHFFTPLS